MIDSAQSTGEEFAVLARRQSFASDQVLQMQRALMYAARDTLLDGGGMDGEKLMEIAEKNIARFIREQTPMTVQDLQRYLLDHISYRLGAQMRSLPTDDPAAVREYLMKRVEQGLTEQEKKIGNRSRLKRFMRVAALGAIDEAWVEQVDYLQQIQGAVAGRAAAQRNPLFEFQKEALESFRKMELTILENIMRNILLSNVFMDEKRQLHILLP